MDSTGISLSGFELATPLSGIRAEAHAGAGIMRMAPDTPLTADLSASLNTEEIKLLYPQLIPAALDDRIVRIKLSAAGTLGDIKKAGLDISSPGHIDLAVNGTAKTCSPRSGWKPRPVSKGSSATWLFCWRCCPTRPCSGA